MNVNDKITTEYESRIMIDESTYNKLVDEYSKLNNASQCININTYFDNSNLLLTTSGIVLRIRITNTCTELTLKIKGKNGDTEITTNVDGKTKNIKDLLTPAMHKLLDQINFDINKLHKVGQLTTERIEVFYEKYTLVIDKNLYGNIVDYNLEIESTSKMESQKYLDYYIAKYKITKNKEYISKSRRAIYQN